MIGVADIENRKGLGGVKCIEGGKWTPSHSAGEVWAGKRGLGQGWTRDKVLLSTPVLRAMIVPPNIGRGRTESFTILGCSFRAIRVFELIYNSFIIRTKQNLPSLLTLLKKKTMHKKWKMRKLA